MSFYDLTVMNADNEVVSMKDFEGKVVLVVNTATGCGFTPQYKDLEEIYEKYHDQGLEIVDVPCNQFAGQTPGTDEEIHNFCTLNYGTQFPQMKKADVNGENESPVYTWLKEQMPSEDIKGLKNKATMAMISKISDSCKKESDIKWNFTKFLVDREGNVVKRYAPVVDPAEIEKDIKGLL